MPNSEKSVRAVCTMISLVGSKPVKTVFVAFMAFEYNLFLEFNSVTRLFITVLTFGVRL